MSQWQHPPGIFSDESYFDEVDYPTHIQRAFIAVEYEDIYAAHAQEEWKGYNHIMKEAIQSFATRWDGLSNDAFLRALQAASGPNRLAAIFAIGQSELPQGTDHIAPFLGSTDQLERCAAAIVLTLQRDERVLPALLPVLAEYLLSDPPPDKQGRYRYTRDASTWYCAYLGHLARVLARWGPPELTPVLRKAFLKVVGRRAAARRILGYLVCSGSPALRIREAGRPFSPGGYNTSSRPSATRHELSSPGASASRRTFRRFLGCHAYKKETLKRLTKGSSSGPH
jgi:hypothetical protein